VEQQLKVPKIKIRIGPSPNAVTTSGKHEPSLLSMQSTSTASIVDLEKIQQTVKEKTPVPSQFENAATTITALLAESKSPNETIITIANPILPLTTTPILIPPLRIAKSPAEKFPNKKSQQMESLPTKKENFKEKKPTSVEANKQPMPISSTASTNLVVQQQQNDEEQEDIWICPVCSVVYVENGPDMVFENFMILPQMRFRLVVTLVTAGIIG
jgi:hypothetical protein